MMRSKRSKTLWTLVATVLFLYARPLAAQQTGAKTFKIPDGTIVRVVLTDTLTSETSHANDQVHFDAAEDVKVGDVVVIAKGSPGIGRVSQADPKGRWGKGGALDFSLDYIKGVDGSNVRLRANSAEKAKISTGALMMGLSGGFKHGKGVKVNKGTTIDAYVDGDREIALAIGH